VRAVFDGAAPGLTVPDNHTPIIQQTRQMAFATRIPCSTPFSSRNLARSSSLESSAKRLACAISPAASNERRLLRPPERAIRQPPTLRQPDSSSSLRHPD
jgi:hypothetical protein